jgi:hypothetical protein
MPTVPLTGIPSEESFSPLNPAQRVLLNSIPSDEEIGELQAVTRESLTGIASEQAVGSFTLRRFASLTGINTAEAIGALSYDIGYVPPDLPFNRLPRPLSVSERFSGVVLNQNETTDADGQLDFTTYSPSSYQYYQEFLLPKDYKRGPSQSSGRIPPLTGLELFVSIAQGWQDVAAFDWIIERYDLGDGWQTLDTGTAVGAPHSGNEVWVSAYATKPIEINDDWLDERFRFGIRSRSSVLERFKEEVEATNTQVIIDGQPHDIVLQQGIPHHFLLDSVPHTLYKDPASGKVYLSVERGIENIWVSHPNPLATQSVKAYGSDGTTPLQVLGEDTSLMFRLLGGIAEQGTDFLGNRYRSTITRTNIENVSTTDTGAQERYWLSKPNPSKFAVENLYFDISDGLNGARAVDRILLDPLTPGVFFNVYYSSEGDPETEDALWENKLWTRVPNVFQMKNRTTHALPTPISARYIKLEFSHLQPKWYAPNAFQKPTLYKKHPKWVLDYFLARLTAERNTEDPFIARTVRVEYDALDLAYNYYLDDLAQGPLTPVELGQRDFDALTNFLRTRNDSSDQIDSTTRSQIGLTLQPYLKHPSSRARINYLLSLYTVGTTSLLQSGERVLRTDYPVELPSTPQAISDQVSALDRESLVIENSMPVMNFFLPCRHKYRTVTASFSNDKAYFAGIKEVAFLRDRYAKAFDQRMYTEASGDTMNSERNDFLMEDGVWTTHNR